MRTVKLAELAANKRWAINGGPFGSKLVSKDYRDEGVPVIRGANLPDSSWFSDDNLVFVSEEKADELLANNAHPGDVIFTQRGTLGQVGLIPLDSPYERYVISQSQMKITVDRSIADPRWLYYYFRQESIVESIKARAVTSGVPHINLGTLKDFEIALPDLKIQEATADCLMALDRQLENHRKQISLLREAARLIYTEWFVRLRFPGHEKAKTSGLLPDGWRQEALGLRIELNYGKSLKESDRQPGEIPVFGSSGIVGSHSGALSHGPGIIVGRKGNVGSIFYSAVPFFAIDTVYFISPEQTTFFLLHTLQRMNFVSSDSAVPGLNRNYAYSQPVIWPSNSVLSGFETTCAAIYEQITTLEKQIGALKSARDLLLPRLISGQLRL